MTLVGPRPERPHFVEKFSSELPPTATGTGSRRADRPRAGQRPARRRYPDLRSRRFDNFYIENWSLWLDAKVLLRTINEVLFARGR